LRQGGVRRSSSVSSIMRGPEHVGEEPSGVRWTDDGRWIYFRWKPGGQPWHEPTALYRVARGGGAPERVGRGRTTPSRVFFATGDCLAPTGRWRVVSYDGDLHLIDRRSMAVRRLTLTRALQSRTRCSRATAAPSITSATTTSSLSLHDGTLRQVTDLRTARRLPSRGPPGQRGFLEQQQRELFEHIRLQAERREQIRRAPARRPASRCSPRTSSANERVASLAVEPGRALRRHLDGSCPAPGRRTSIPFWVTESGYTEPREMRTKVGDEQDIRAAWASYRSRTARCAGSMSLRATRPDGDTTAPARVRLTRFIGWNDQGTAGLVAATSADFKQAWLWSMDAAYRRADTAHARSGRGLGRGPCPFWSNPRCSGWLPDGRGPGSSASATATPPLHRQCRRHPPAPAHGAANGRCTRRDLAARTAST
jgi:hypothetical protein